MHIGAYPLSPPVTVAPPVRRTRRGCWIDLDVEGSVHKSRDIPRMDPAAFPCPCPSVAACADTLPPRRLFSFITSPLPVRLDVSPRSPDLSFLYIGMIFVTFYLFRTCQRARLDSSTQLDANYYPKNSRQTRLRLRFAPLNLPCLCFCSVPAASQHPQRLKTTFLLAVGALGMFIKPIISFKYA